MCDLLNKDMKIEQEALWLLYIRFCLFVMKIFVSVTSFPYNIDVLNGNLLCNSVHYFASIAKSHAHCREHRLDVACLNCLCLDIKFKTINIRE
jgi:hypothetical protein